MFEKPTGSQRIQPGHDPGSHARGHAGAPFDPERDEVFAHQAGATQRSREDAARMERDQQDHERAMAGMRGAAGRDDSHSDGAAFVFGAIVRIIAWPVLTLFVAATLPMRIARRLAGGTPAAWRIVLAVGEGTLVAIGTLFIVLVGWVWPGLWLVDQAAGPDAFDSPGPLYWVGVVLVAASASLPAWIWNSRVIAALGDVDDVRVAGSLRWTVHGIAAIGVAWVLIVVT